MLSHFSFGLVWFLGLQTFRLGWFFVTTFETSSILRQLVRSIPVTSNFLMKFYERCINTNSINMTHSWMMLVTTLHTKQSVTSVFILRTISILFWSCTWEELSNDLVLGNFIFMSAILTNSQAQYLILISSNRSMSLFMVVFQYI